MTQPDLEQIEDARDHYASPHRPGFARAPAAPCAAPPYMASAPRMIDPSRPFVLLDDAREADAAPARLYSGPAEIDETRDPEEVRPCTDRLRPAKGRGSPSAGFPAAEAGPARGTKTN